MKHNYIRDDIIIDFPVPNSLKMAFQDAEEQDALKSVVYLCSCDLIDVTCKNCYASGKITQEQWDIIVTKYSEDGYWNSSER